MKKFLLAIILFLMSVPAFAAGHVACEMPKTINALMIIYKEAGVKSTEAAGYDQAIWIKFMSDNVRFKTSRMVKMADLKPGDYSLTLCQADFEITNPDGSHQTWKQDYIVHYDDLYYMDNRDPQRFVIAALEFYK